MIVVDASAWVTSVIDSGARGDACRTALLGDLSWAAPPHAPLEVLRTIRRCEIDRLVTPAQADLHAAQVRATEIRLIMDEDLLRDAWRLRHNLSVYDAPYVSLALRYDVELVTLDLRLARAADSLGARVTVPGSDRA